MYVCRYHLKLSEPTGQGQGRVPVKVLQVHVTALLRLPHQPLQQGQVTVPTYIHIHTYIHTQLKSVDISAYIHTYIHIN